MSNIDFSNNLNVEEALTKVAMGDVTGDSATPATELLIEFVGKRFEPGTREAAPPIDGTALERLEGLIWEVLSDFGNRRLLIYYAA